MKGFLHFLFKLITHCSKAQRHEFRPSVVAMAERILITVWMISFQVSLFFIRSLVKGLVFSLLALRPSNVMLNLFQHLTASLSCSSPRTDPETSSG